MNTQLNLKTLKIKIKTALERWWDNKYKIYKK